MVNLDNFKPVLILVAAVCALFTVAGPAVAAPPAAQKTTPVAAPTNPAVDTYITMLGAVAVMTNRFARLADVKVGISGDCRGKQKLYSNVADITTFCQCAATVTVALWMTYPSVESRRAIGDLIDKNTGTLGALIPLQSPDMYNSICQAVTADIANSVKLKGGPSK